MDSQEVVNTQRTTMDQTNYSKTNNRNKMVLCKGEAFQSRGLRWAELKKTVGMTG